MLLIIPDDALRGYCFDVYDSSFHVGHVIEY